MYLMDKLLFAKVTQQAAKSRKKGVRRRKAAAPCAYLFFGAIRSMVEQYQDDNLTIQH